MPPFYESYLHKLALFTFLITPVISIKNHNIYIIHFRFNIYRTNIYIIPAKQQIQIKQHLYFRIFFQYNIRIIYLPRTLLIFTYFIIYCFLLYKIFI